MNKKTRKERFKEYIEETLLNKLLALVLLVTGILSAILTKEGNALVLSLLIGVPLLFAKENWIG